MSSLPGPPVAENDRVVEILRGAERGPRDPDIELAKLLITLGADDDRVAVMDVLQQLASDARPD